MQTQFPGKLPSSRLNLIFFMFRYLAFGFIDLRRICSDSYRLLIYLYSWITHLVTKRSMLLKNGYDILKISWLELKCGYGYFNWPFKSTSNCLNWDRLHYIPNWNGCIKVYFSSEDSQARSFFCTCNLAQGLFKRRPFLEGIFFLPFHDSASRNFRTSKSVHWRFQSV